MTVFNIEKLKVILPSPDNFILQLDLSRQYEDSAIAESEIYKTYNFIASGEHVFVNKNNEIDKSLINNHVAHSSVFDISGRTITAFSMFDMNDMGITTHDNVDIDENINSNTEDHDIFDNLLLLSNANTLPSARVNSNIILHSINSNSVYGYITPTRYSFGFPGYNDSIEEKHNFVITTHNANSQCIDSEANVKPIGKSDTLTLYHPNKMATTISSILSLGNQIDLQDVNENTECFDKVFVFDPTDNNRLEFDENSIEYWRKYQSNLNHAQEHVTNCFDNGLLIARAFIFPKQTLNNEYSTVKDYLHNDSPPPYEYVRKYKWDDTHFYSNCTQIVFNHRDDNTIATSYINPTEKTTAGTMVTSTYSKRFGSDQTHVHGLLQPPAPSALLSVESDYNYYYTFQFGNSALNTRGIFNQYSPELFNRENETMSDTALLTSKHKTNIFDISFKKRWETICNQFNPKTEQEVEAYKKIKSDLKDSIRSNLYKLVDEIKPVNTELYKIEIDG